MERKQQVALYIRISTGEQDLAAQEYELKSYAEIRGWRISRIYRDVLSGATTSRPGLDELMKDARRGKFQFVLTWKFDRFGRSLRHLVTALEEFKRLKIDFISATEGIDTSTPGGELAFQIFGAMAQFERALIRERVKAGLAQAVREGRRLGRRPIRILSDEDIRKIREDRKTAKLSLRKLAQKHRTTIWSVQKAVSTLEAAA
jgi:DNA invertase Pin-like site-specific DNA recombinase